MHAWDNLTARIRELDALGGANALLEWDQQTYMPPRAADARGEQMALLQRLYHERFTDPAVGGWLDQLEAAGLDATQVAAVRNLRRKYRRAVCLPTRLVEDLARARNDGFGAW
ncbi:MAG: carboxypeptidase M32, partial [Deltaproteobacteria bacterium]|nr:carboxypeptidase M32 [Deltaproteobacteria bacterium]